MPTPSPSGPTPTYLNADQMREYLQKVNWPPANLEEARRPARSVSLEKNRSPETIKANAELLRRLLKGRETHFNTADS